MARFGRKSEKAEALRDVPLFAGLGQKDLEMLASHVDEAEVEAGTRLAEQGRKGRQLSLIVEGAATVERDGKKLADLGPGDVVGEMSLVDHAEANATVVTTEPSVLLVMHAKDFSEVLDGSPGFARKLLGTLVRRLREADRQLVG